MGEKSGGLWLIVIVVVLAGLLIAALAIFFPDAIDAIALKFNTLLTGTDTTPPTYTP